MATFDEPALTAAGPALTAAGPAHAGSALVVPAEPGAPTSAVLAAQFRYQYPPRGRFTSAVLRFWERAPRWVAPAGVAGLIGSAVAYTYLVHPTTAPTTCLFRLLTGFDCPGCGGTRAAWFLLHGDLPDAARHHAPFVFAVPFLLYMYLEWALRTTFGRKLPKLQLSPVTLMVFLAAWFAFSVLRNLPWAPFTWLYV